ncbi:MAG TPA: hypothetical protein VFN25_05570 [Dokdonella sp.]|uniref:hypothetical protein n=1 Tax=Dokdonella sp. TaxID=2291710 RepID=UPI002D7ECC0A|nr:hypothetical protein [Dokdonella sp.]HET9032359.1 hypothetical protein [Dokdonella sp.]
MRERSIVFAIGLALVCMIAMPGSAQAVNPFTAWKDRLFGEQPSKPRPKKAPEHGVVLLGLDRAERVVIVPDSEQRKFPKGKSRYREIELQREFKHVAVRIQVIADSNPNGRGNAVFKPVLYVLDDNGKVTDSTIVEPLEIDIRPFKPTRLLACVNLENVRRFAVATPSSAPGKFYESRSRDKLKASSKGGYYYSTDAVKVRLPYLETGEFVIEVSRVNKKGEGC